ncbi:hypothetical protein CAPTEDRAFT_205133 [Capitella teleta]|uniref:Uncharacterized protein n=1 Tax=Capitella teleta TaxID=283909 RepID=R7TZK0_CAPTE|nr:hypothetical protein CAPTEDRAFT_205133 [Capitella teleta]|eukprot:ELT96801.1 hypothetical protein CAPTEDRAFT_205133 [Capitella teleta]
MGIMISKYNLKVALTDRDPRMNIHVYYVPVRLAYSLDVRYSSLTVAPTNKQVLFCLACITTGKVIECNHSTIEHDCDCANEWWEPAIEECTPCDEICAFDAPICRQYCNVFAATKFDPMTDQGSSYLYFIFVPVCLAMAAALICLVIYINRDKCLAKFGVPETDKVCLQQDSETMGAEGIQGNSSDEDSPLCVL